jgi:hypothetical protein
MSNSRATFNDLPAFKCNKFCGVSSDRVCHPLNFDLKFGRRSGDGKLKRVLGMELSRSGTTDNKGCLNKEQASKQAATRNPF